MLSSGGTSESLTFSGGAGGICPEGCSGFSIFSSSGMCSASLPVSGCGGAGVDVEQVKREIERVHSDRKNPGR